MTLSPDLYLFLFIKNDQVKATEKENIGTFVS